MASTKSSGQELDNGSQKQPHFSACRTEFFAEEDGWVHTSSLIYSGTNSWCYRFMKCKRTVMSFKKEDITPTLGSNEGSAMSEKGKSLNSNISNEECNSSDADFRGLYHQ